MSFFDRPCFASKCYDHFFVQYSNKNRIWNEFVNYFGGFKAEIKFVKAEETYALLRKLSSMKKYLNECRRTPESLYEPACALSPSTYPLHHPRLALDGDKVSFFTC